MDEKDWRRIIPKVGVDLVFAGDHRHHLALAPEGDKHMVWDNDSLTLTIYLDEYDAKELFWDLLEIIPKLRHDRR